MLNVWECCDKIGTYKQCLSTCSSRKYGEFAEAQHEKGTYKSATQVKLKIDTKAGTKANILLVIMAVNLTFAAQISKTGI